MVSFRKQSDRWVVFGPMSEVKVGMVQVTKRDNSTTVVEVVKVSKSFLVDGVKHRYGYLAEGEGKVKSYPPKPDKDTPRCADCGRRTWNLYQDLEDGGMKCYNCCDMPAND